MAAKLIKTKSWKKPMCPITDELTKRIWFVAFCLLVSYSEFLYLCSLERLACDLSFLLLGSLLVLVSVYTRNDFGRISPISISLKNQYYSVIRSSLNFQQNQSVNPSGPELSFVDRFLIITLNPLIVIKLFKSFMST